jgi:hypothetical protein
VNGWYTSVLLTVCAAYLATDGHWVLAAILMFLVSMFVLGIHVGNERKLPPTQNKVKKD